ncbi:MerR family transcriptional regulator [Deinococcus koreensis]|uniref:MerR family transcriptional regulator n=1 Tax=Deinococcus koreensis TaxID=2054903 RepID=A0A2K3UYS6_9DEIO|nr:MerR family transcriptional regulator [Deinococcus koreensis]PNY81675.1 MerR family transcriptional regulator [Deinococcus koreensis]
MTPATSALLTIGAFSRASRLSVKALRLYDALGLLTPGRVDEQSGYRLYSPSQLEAAGLIGLLRAIEMPLQEIRTLLDAPRAEQARLIETYWAGAQALHAERAGVARHLIHTLRGDTMTQSYEVQTRDVPAQTVATIQRRLYLPDLSPFIGSAMERLHAELRAQGAEAAGPPVVIYHGEVNADSDGPVEVCVPYTGTLRPGAEITLREEGAHAEAYVTVLKKNFEYHELMSAYAAVDRYARQHGAHIGLSCREVYPYDWDAAGPEDPAGEVACPYAPAPVGG